MKDDWETNSLAAWLRSSFREAHQEHAGGGESSSARIPLPTYFGAPDGEQPGQFPFSRGISPRGYLDQPWVMGMYSGYATPRETNERFKALLATGQTGLSIALDLPTQIGIDSDHPLAAGEVGKVGVPLNTVDDVLTLLDGLPISQIRQMRTTANAIGPFFLAFAIVALEEMGVDLSSFELFLQNDPLKEFTARGTWIFPPRPSLKLAVDAVEHIAKNYPQWRPQQYCGYHIRDAGGTAVEELAVAMANGVAYFEEALSRGVSADQLAPQMFFFLAAGLDIFEEAAKFRAARRLWARLLHDRYGVSPELCGVKIFSYTLGGALWAQEPANNITRIAYEALAAALGGVQTLATSSWDEAHSLPSADAANLSVRTQQILAYESGVTKVVDPLGGSHYVEGLTDRIEAAVAHQLAAILDRGGAVVGIEDGYIESMLADSAYREFEAVQSGKRIVVGVNFKAKENDTAWRSGFVMPPGVADEAIMELNATRDRRDPQRHERALADLAAAARAGINTLPALIEAARARASMGEITDTLASVYGRHGAAQAA